MLKRLIVILLLVSISFLYSCGKDNSSSFSISDEAVLSKMISKKENVNVNTFDKYGYEADLYYFVEIEYDFNDADGRNTLVYYAHFKTSSNRLTYFTEANISVYQSIYDSYLKASVDGTHYSYTSTETDVILDKAILLNQ